MRTFEDRFRKPQPWQLTFRKGDRVWHENGYGRGEIARQWGSFMACKACARDRTHPDGTCLACGGLMQMIPTDDIFEVKFKDGKTRAINCVWLHPVA
jgi:hypothetical protein